MATKAISFLSSKISSRQSIRYLNKRLLSTSSIHNNDKNSDLQRKYSLDGFYWIDVRSPFKNKWDVSIGLTDYLFETRVLGTVEDISFTIQNISLNSTMKIKWSGLKTGKGDELYHSVWENVEEQEILPLPIQIKGINHIVYNNNNLEVLENINNDEKQWIYRFCCSDNHSEYRAFSLLLKQLRNKIEHDSFCLLQSKAIGEKEDVTSDTPK